MAKQASYCKECGKELSFISKRLHNGLCTDCFIEETMPTPHCKQCGKELDSKTYRDVCPDCILEEKLEENKRRKGYCKECGKKLPAKPDLNWDRTEYLVDVCSDCEFVEYIDGEPIKPGEFTAQYVGGYGAYPEPLYVLMLTYPGHLEVPELGLTIPYDQLQNVQSMTKKDLSLGNVMLFGLWGFAMKKRTDYLIITFNDVVGIEQNPVFDVLGKISEIQPFLYEQMENARMG
jgi:hypothetical protein